MGHIGTRTGDGELVQRVPMIRRSLMTEPLTIPGSSQHDADGLLSVPSDASTDDVVASVRGLDCVGHTRSLGRGRPSGRAGRCS